MKSISQEQAMVTDAEFARRFREGWGAPSLTVQERVAFDRDVWRRVELVQRQRWVPALVGVAVVALMVVMVWVGRLRPGRSADWLSSLYEAEVAAETEVAVAETADLAGWRMGNLAADDVAGDVSSEYGLLAQWVIVARNEQNEGEWLP